MLIVTLCIVGMLVSLIPAVHILQRAGLSRWWGMLFVLPVVGWIGLWMFAFAPWPAVDREVQTSVF